MALHGACNRQAGQAHGAGKQGQLERGAERGKRPRIEEQPPRKLHGILLARQAFDCLISIL